MPLVGHVRCPLPSSIVMDERESRRSRCSSVAGNVPFPATTPIPAPMAVGVRDPQAAGQADTFPAMTTDRQRVRRLRPMRDRVLRLGEAVDAFLAQPDLAASSRRSYTQTLGRLREALGAERPLDRLSARELESVAREAWSATAPATWNRHVATLRSFAGFCQRRGWLEAAIAVGLEAPPRTGRPEPRAAPRAALAAWEGYISRLSQFSVGGRVPGSASVVTVGLMV
jgi:hypothetical protein